VTKTEQLAQAWLTAKTNGDKAAAEDAFSGLVACCIVACRGIYPPYIPNLGACEFVGSSPWHKRTVWIQSFVESELWELRAGRAKDGLRYIGRRAYFGIVDSVRQATREQRPITDLSMSPEELKSIARSVHLSDVKLNNLFQLLVGMYPKWMSNCAIARACGCSEKVIRRRRARLANLLWPRAAGNTRFSEMLISLKIRRGHLRTAKRLKVSEFQHQSE
jgi:hypothetical protein